MEKLLQPFDEVFFTISHEWIRFEGNTAIFGLSPFKLTGFKRINQFFVSEIHGIVKAGTNLATLEYSDYIVTLHMPVDGEVMGWNNALLQESPATMLSKMLQFDWLARITPQQPCERKHLIPPIHYKALEKTKYALKPLIQ